MRKGHAGACAIGGGPSNSIEAAGLHHAGLFVPCFSLAAAPTVDFESGGFLGLARFARSRCGRTTDPPVNHSLTNSRLLNLHMVCTFPPCLVGVLVGPADVGWESDARGRGGDQGGIRRLREGPEAV